MRNALLFEACRLSASDASTSGDTSALDWIYLQRAADRQGIGPLLHDWLRRRPEIHVPQETSCWLNDTYWTSHFRNRVFLAELDRFRRVAAARGVEIIPLKGAVLAADFYPAPALRPMSDVDLLVRVDDLPAIGDLLAASGYTPRDPLPSYVGDHHLDRASREHVWTVNRDGIDVIVEYRAAAIQTTISRLGDLDPTLSAALGDCTEAMWSRATRSATDGGLRLAREDLLLLCAAHLAAQHSDFRLIWLHDLARIASHSPRAIDWDDVCGRAASLRIEAPIWAALQAAAQWIGAPIDRRALETLRTATVAGSGVMARWEHARLREHVAGLADADLSSPGFALWPFGAAVGRMRGWRPRLTALRWALFPSRDYLTRHGEPPPGVLGYVATWTRRAFLALTRTSAHGSEGRGRPLS